jgi:hypothetical protein
MPSHCSRPFSADLYTAEYEDRLARARGNELAMRTAALREYESLNLIIIHSLGLAPEGWLASPYEAIEDEERREARRKFVEVHPPALLREDGTTIPPQRSGIGAGVARLQDYAFPRRRRTLTMFMPCKEDSS